MKVPTPPPIQELERITPTIYEAALKCHARASWTARGENADVPRHPRALLGLGAHAVLEGARRGAIDDSEIGERRKAAGRLFDSTMEELFQKAHPLLVAKFGSHVRLPYYHLQRERTALMAAGLAEVRRPSRDASIVATAGTGRLVESMLQSRDGKIAGRPDVVDPVSGMVIDFKTGVLGDSSSLLADSEVRQLRLYVHLASENGIGIRRGVIERANRTRAEIPITPDQAAEEGRRARVVLDEYNRYAGQPFDSGASASPDACRFCPCIPFCEAFWSRAAVDWSGQCGIHIEGAVESVEGAELVSINLNVTRGTGARGAAVVTRLSREWLTFSGAEMPRPQQTMRVTDAAYVEESSAPAVFRADRITTAVWMVASGEH